MLISGLPENTKNQQDHSTETELENEKLQAKLAERKLALEQEKAKQQEQENEQLRVKLKEHMLAKEREVVERKLALEQEKAKQQEEENAQLRAKLKALELAKERGLSTPAATAVTTQHIYGNDGAEIFGGFEDDADTGEVNDAMANASPMGTENTKAFGFGDEPPALAVIDPTLKPPTAASAAAAKESSETKGSGGSIKQEEVEQEVFDGFAADRQVGDQDDIYDPATMDYNSSNDMGGDIYDANTMPDASENDAAVEGSNGIDQPHYAAYNTEQPHYAGVSADEIKTATLKQRRGKADGDGDANEEAHDVVDGTDTGGVALGDNDDGVHHGAATASGTDVCAYTSERGNCTQPSENNADFCAKHRCPGKWCTQSKSQSVPMCANCVENGNQPSAETGESLDTFPGATTAAVARGTETVTITRASVTEKWGLSFSAAKMRGSTNVVVDKVESGSPVEVSGIQPGDIVQAIDGIPAKQLAGAGEAEKAIDSSIKMELELVVVRKPSPSAGGGTSGGPVRRNSAVKAVQPHWYDFWKYLAPLLFYYGDFATDVFQIYQVYYEQGVLECDIISIMSAWVMIVFLLLLPATLSAIDIYTRNIGGLGWLGVLLNATQTRMVYVTLYPFFGSDSVDKQEAATKASKDLKLLEAALEGLPQLNVQVILLAIGILRIDEWITWASIATSMITAAIALEDKLVSLVGEYMSVCTIGGIWAYFLFDAIARSTTYAV